MKIIILIFLCAMLIPTAAACRSDINGDAAADSDITIDTEENDESEAESEMQTGVESTEAETEHAETFQTETETTVPETTAPEVLPITDVNAIFGDSGVGYLDDILADKNFSDEVKQLIRSVYMSIADNYDNTYAYEKTDKNEYLNEFCEYVKNGLDIALLIDPDDSPRDYSEVFDDPSVAGFTEDERILMIDYGSRNIQTMAHEIAHLKNQDLYCVLGNTVLDVAKLVREGMSSRAEDFCLPVKRSNWVSIPKNRVSAFNELFETDDENSYVSPYKFYERMTEHLETLVGMSRLNEIVSADGDFIENIRNELISRYDKEHSDEFLSCFIAASAFVKESEIEGLKNCGWMINSLNNSIKYNQIYLECDPDRLYKQISDRIWSLQTQIDYEIRWREENKDEAMIDLELFEEYENSLWYIEYYTKIMNYYKDALTYYDYDRIIDNTQFELYTDTKTKRYIENYMENGEDSIVYCFVELEKSMHVLLTEIIKKAATQEEYAEVYELCENYDRNIRLICRNEETDMASDDYDATVRRELMLKAEELGIEQTDEEF